MPDQISIEQRIKRHEAQAARLRAKLSQHARKLDTRRKVLTGACLLAEIEHDAELRQRVATILDRRLQRSDDRAALQELLPNSDHGALRT